MFNPSHPGEILREKRIKPLGITIKEAVFKPGITRQNLSDIVSCKAGISPAMALKLAKAFKLLLMYGWECRCSMIYGRLNKKQTWTVFR